MTRGFFSFSPINGYSKNKQWIPFQALKFFLGFFTCFLINPRETLASYLIQSPQPHSTLFLRFLLQHSLNLFRPTYFMQPIGDGTLWNMQRLFDFSITFA